MNPQDLKRAPKWFRSWYENDYSHLEKDVNRIKWIAWSILFSLLAGLTVVVVTSWLGL